MASERTSRGWIGYDWFKLLIGLLFVVLIFQNRPDQIATSAIAPTAKVMVPTVVAAIATIAPTATAPVVSTATSAPTVMSGATPTRVPTPPMTQTPTPPGALVITTPIEGQQVPAGPIIISGSGVAGMLIDILNGDQLIATTIVNDDGTWSVTYTPNTAGTATLTVRPNNGTSASKPIRITLDPAVQASCTQLAIGCDAWVTRIGGFALRMRSGPSTDQPIIARLPIGTQVQIVDGSRSANQYTWWRVRTTNGSEGWISGENLVLQPD